MTVKLNPVVVSSDGSQHQSLPAGTFIDDASIDKAALVSAQAGNTLVGLSDGLYVAPATVDAKTLISSDAGNSLTTGADNKLKVSVPTIDAKSLVSQDLANDLTVDADGKLMVEATDVANDIVSNATNNALTQASDKKLFVRVVSTDTGNVLSTGSDNGAFANAHSVVSTATVNNLLKVSSSDGKLAVASSDVRTEMQNKLTIVSAQSDNALSAGSDKGAFLSKDDLKVYSAGQGISISGTSVGVNAGTGLAFSGSQLVVDATNIHNITVPSTEKILNINSGNEVTATLTATLDSSSNLILSGKNGVEITRVYIPTGSSILKSVEIVTNPAGKDPGNYFKFVFEISGTDEVVYAKLPETSTIIAGAGVSIASTDTTDTIAIKCKTAGGLATDDSGLYIAVNYAMQTDLENVSAMAQTNKQSIATLQGTVTTLGDSVTANTTNIAANKTAVEKAQAQADTNKQSIADLELNTAVLNVTSSEPAPSSLSNGTGVLYPAVDLL
jgi:hypothetical protein